MDPNANLIASDIPEAKHAYTATGVTNDKIIWVVLVNFLASMAISVIAPVLYLVIIGFVVGIGLTLCNVCGIISIIAPLALLIPWFFGAGIAMLANTINIAMQKKTNNNSKLLHWFFLVFTILGILVVFLALSLNRAEMDLTDDIDKLAGWLLTALILYGALTMIGSILFIGHTEPLPPYCEECEEYMQEITLPSIPVGNVNLLKPGLDQRRFLQVLKAILQHKPETAISPKERQQKNENKESFPLQKDFVFHYFYCKHGRKTGVLEVVYCTEEQKIKNNDRMESNKVEQRIFSTLLNAAEVQSLTPVMQKLQAHLGEPPSQKK